MSTTSPLRCLNVLAAAGAAALLATPGFAADQIGFLPIEYNQLKTWTVTEFVSDDGDSVSDYYVQDMSTNQKWDFRSGTKTFYDMLTKLHDVSDDNVKQFAYVGDASGDGDFLTHGAWIAPLTKDKAPSLVRFRTTDMRWFDSATLHVQWSDQSHDYVLSAGNRVLAENPDSQDLAPLVALQTMIQSYGLNTVWEIPTDKSWATTPVGSQGPILVFLRAAPVSTASDECGDHAWWRLPCWHVGSRSAFAQ